MSEFDAALRELAGRLGLPEPTRSRVLLELRSDLESMAATLRAEGADGEEARDRAIETLMPSPETVAELASLHRPLYERWVARLSAPGRHGLERVLVGSLAVVYLVTGIMLLARLELLAAPSPFLWPVLFLGVVMATAAGVKLFQLFVLGSRGARSRRGLRLLPVLAAMTLVVALGGAAADLYVVSAEIQADASRQLPVLLEWFQREVVLVSVAILAAGGAGIAWLLAAGRIAYIEQTEIEALGYGPGAPHERGRES